MSDRAEFRERIAFVLLVLVLPVSLYAAGGETRPADVVTVQVAAKPVWNCGEEPHPWVIWRAPTGGKVASPAVAGDRILIGSNNEAHGNDAAPGGGFGVMMCFSASNGDFLWQTRHARLGLRRNDLPGTPIGSRPAIDGDRAYYVSNRGELVCVALSSRSSAEVPHVEATPGGIIWKLDMPSSLGVEKIDAPDIGNPLCSPLVVDDFVYCVTGNGGDFDGIRAPDAPSFLAANKLTGKIVWTSNAPGKNIVYGQWSSPALAVVSGRKQIVFPGGDGYLYGFQPQTGEQLWKIDLGGPVSAGDKNYRGLGRRNFFVGAPVVHGDTVYVGLDQIPEDNLMKTRRPVFAVNLEARGGSTVPHIKWTFDYKTFDGTTAAVAVTDDRVYVVSRSGRLFALDAAQGNPIWLCDLQEPAALFSAPVVHSDRLYVTGEQGLFVVALKPQPHYLGRFEFGQGLQNNSPAFVDDRIYFGSRGYLWCLKSPPVN
jgi:outer membrane protein assembly factor BamB